jgi:hypothetical protein
MSKKDEPIPHRITRNDHAVRFWRLRIFFWDHGSTWRRANTGHVNLGQMKVMSAVENCCTAALGSHVVRCEDYSHKERKYSI